MPRGANLEIFLTDDRSTDGTAQAVKDAFSDVHLLQGSGSLFWGGGMRLAFAEAMKSDFDFYLWVNDDTFLFQHAIVRLLERYESVRTGGKDAIVISPSDFPQPCDIANGNCVWVPKTLPKP